MRVWLAWLLVLGGCSSPVLLGTLPGDLSGADLLCVSCDAEPPANADMGDGFEPIGWPFDLGNADAHGD
jgi:hypothetical protein